MFVLFQMYKKKDMQRFECVVLFSWIIRFVYINYVHKISYGQWINGEYFTCDFSNSLFH